MSNSKLPSTTASYTYNPVKNYRRGIADFFGTILLKRQRIAGDVSTLCSRQGRGMGGHGRFWTIYTCVYINICIRTIYTYVVLLIGTNNCVDNCVCVANNNCELSRNTHSRLHNYWPILIICSIRIYSSYTIEYGLWGFHNY